MHLMVPYIYEALSYSFSFLSSTVPWEECSLTEVPPHVNMGPGNITPGAQTQFMHLIYSNSSAFLLGICPPSLSFHEA